MDERLSQAIKYKNALEAMVKSPGWNILVDMITENIHNRRETILLQPLSSMDEVLSQEFRKGEVTGFQTSLLLPDHKIDECEALIDSFKEKDDGDEEESPGNSG